MPHIIQRYIFREMAIPFLFSIGIFTITSLLSKIPHLIQLMINHGVGFLVVVQFIVFILPSILIYVIPVSFLIAVLIAYNRLSSDNEITAMKASGLSILKISRSVAIMALFAYSISSFFTIYAFPWGSLSSKRLIYDMARSKASIGLRERVFNSAFNGLILYANRIITENGELEGIFISDQRDEKDNNIIVAKSGIISSDYQTMKITLRLFNGRVHRSGEKGLYKIVTFNTYDLNLSLKDEEIKNPDTSKTNKDLTVSQLKEKIDDMKRGGRDPSPHIIDLHKRFALPASVFVFGLLGIPLGIQRVRTIRFTSFTIGLGVMLFYYVLSKALESLGEKGLLNPVLAVWGTDILMAALGVTMFYKAAKDSPVKSLAWLEEKKDAALVIIKAALLRRKG
ncbi:MAG: LPS export ABC transporter permease LptF [Deltaproteobacteria bacterium]|nr:LPS export ABC transporter permease LptF [Deltaproteobacteria bacterium]